MGRHTIGLILGNPIDRHLLLEFLKELGHDVYLPCEGSGEPEFRPGSSLILVDGEAARFYGRWLLDLRWQAGVEYLPILIILPQKADSTGALQAGFDDVLRQPITKAELEARLNVFLRFRRHSEQYQQIFENAPVGIYRSTIGGRVLMANPALVQMLGYATFAELAGSTADAPRLRELPTQEDLAARVVEEDMVQGLETVWTRRDGAFLLALESARVVRDETGNAIFIEGSVEDISERKRAEQALKESEQRYHAIVAALAEGITLHDATGVIAEVNQSAEKILGLPADELVGRTSSDPRWNAVHEDGSIFPGDEHPPMVALRTGRSRSNIVMGVTRPNGALAWLSVNAQPLLDDAGLPTGVVSSFLDITARKIAEQELREHTEIVEIINRVGQTLSAELDLQNVVQAVTDAATELTGAQFGSFFYNVMGEQEGDSYMIFTLSGVPRSAFEHFPMPRATDLFGPTFRGEGTVRIADVKLDPRYGRNSPYYGMPPGHLPVTSYLAVPVLSRSGEVLGGLFFGHPDAGIFSERDERIVAGLAAQTAIAMDNARLFELVTRERAQAESVARQNALLYEEADRANRLKDEFLATVSHELRTPLTAIIGWTALLRGGGLDAETMATGIETIHRNARAQSQIIEDLMDMSRIITGKLRLDVQRVALESIVRTTVDSLRPAAEARGITLDLVFDPQSTVVAGDQVRLQQVAWNLLSNAIKFTPQGGTVQVRLERVESQIELVVADSGIGIDPEFLPYVFDRFRQADGTTTRVHGGLGLGLAIVRNLVELHGGTVRVESRGEGQGTTFIVLLPCQAVDRDTVDGGKEQTKLDAGGSMECPPELDGLCVLVVDDEPDTRNMLRMVLERCRARVVLAGSVQEALDAIESIRPDVLISDIGMPHEDGYALIKKVRALPAELGQLPSAALTAYTGAEERRKVMLAGFQVHVPKPVDPEELMAVVAGLAGRSAML